MRERELERLVAAKEAALQQSERLRLQYASSGASASNADVSTRSVRYCRRYCTFCEEKSDHGI